MHLVFCGTPQFAVPALERLAACHQIALVVTQPDRPRGRGMELAASPVKQAAQKLGLSLAQPEKIRNNPEFRAQLEALAPQAIIVVGYGRIVPPWMLALPRFGNINLHASLLPRYRGAAPIQWAIAEGESVTGNTTMLLNEGLDTGDILLQQQEPIAADDTAVTLAPRLAARGAELMIETLRGLETGTLQPRPQDDSRASLAPILEKEDGEIRWSDAAERIANRLRGFQPWPGAFTRFRGKQLTIHAAKPTGATSGAIGSVTVTDNDVMATCGAGALELVEVQPEGKRRMSAMDWFNGYRPRAEERLGE